jgi:hypothetical protein
MNSMTDPSHPKQNSGQALGVTVRLKPAGPADQPVLVNYTHVGLAEGLAYLDFGFLEPALLGAVVQRVKQGEALPEHLEGARSARVALPLDSVVRLYQQLQQVLVGLPSRKPKHS